MRAGFSELQFAYGCTREIEDGCFFAGIGVPYFPSLVEEAKKGYDVKFPTLLAPIFLQYKVADEMVRQSAGEWSFVEG